MKILGYEYNGTLYCVECTESAKFSRANYGFTLGFLHKPTARNGGLYIGDYKIKPFYTGFQCHDCQKFYLDDSTYLLDKDIGYRWKYRRKKEVE